MALSSLRKSSVRCQENTGYRYPPLGNVFRLSGNPTLTDLLGRSVSEVKALGLLDACLSQLRHKGD